MVAVPPEEGVVGGQAVLVVTKEAPNTHHGQDRGHQAEAQLEQSLHPSCWHTSGLGSYPGHYICCCTDTLLSTASLHHRLPFQC